MIIYLYVNVVIIFFYRKIIENMLVSTILFLLSLKVSISLIHNMMILHNFTFFK